MQMANRGNGKGGGIAAVGLDPAQMRAQGGPEDHHLVQVAYPDPSLPRGAGVRVHVSKARTCTPGTRWRESQDDPGPGRTCR